MLEIAADAASMEIGAGVTIAARGVTSKGEAELLAIWCKHGMLTPGTRGNGGSWLSSDGLFRLAFGGEVTRGTTSKAKGSRAFTRWLRGDFVGNVTLGRGNDGSGHRLDDVVNGDPCRDYGESIGIECA